MKIVTVASDRVLKFVIWKVYSFKGSERLEKLFLWDNIRRKCSGHMTKVSCVQKDRLSNSRGVTVPVKCFTFRLYLEKINVFKHLLYTKSKTSDTILLSFNKFENYLILNFQTVLFEADGLSFKER